MWEEDSSMDSAVAIGFQEGGLYVFLGKSIQDSEDDKEVQDEQKGHLATDYIMAEDLQKDSAEADHMTEDDFSWKELTHDSGMIQKTEGVGIFCDSLMEDEDNQDFSCDMALVSIVTYPDNKELHSGGFSMMEIFYCLLL